MTHSDQPGEPGQPEQHDQPRRSQLLPEEFPVPGSGALEDWWPLFGLRVESDALLLRTVQDADVPAHLAALNEGIHEDTGINPFGPNRWTSAPAPHIAPNALRDIWGNRAQTTPERWTIQLGIWDREADQTASGAAGGPDGRLIGNIVLRSTAFRVTRTVDTGSWITRSSQGRGLGRLARAMTLVLAVDHLGAVAATSECADWNESSAAVSLALGYRPNGGEVQDWAGRPQAVRQFHLSAEELVRPEQEVTVTGAGPVREFLRIRTP